MEVSDFEETSRSTRMGNASHVPPGDSSRDNFEQGDSELPSSSGRLTESAQGVRLDRYGSGQNSSLQLDEVKHKVFLSHSGAQKDFAEQLCADLERRGFIAPFFDQRHHSLPKGKDFVPLIKEAARHCDVAVMVLSEEFLCSKWPMIELAEFHAAQQAGNQRLSMLPVFYKLSVKDLGEAAIEECWKPMWKHLASSDIRIDVEKWSDAVRALGKANGVVFGQKGLSEVGYRKEIVQSIFKFSPPDLLYGSCRKMVGYGRLCKRHDRRPFILGLYGTSGAGKTTLAKALCDHFSGEYMGRVCHVELGETPRIGGACHVNLDETWRLRRVKRMLGRLCGLDKEVLDRISDVDEGLEVMRTHMKREPVFLAMDNVTNDGNSWGEAREYLVVGFHPESRIVITSRSRSNMEGLVPDMQSCVPMPRLSVTEAGELFLRSAAPSKSISGLTAEERRIVGLCIQQCLFYEGEEDEVGCDSSDDEVGFMVEGNARRARARWKSYHPAALRALGDFFRRYFSNGDMLQWRSHLEENKHPLRDLWKVRNGIGGIVGFHFHSLPPSEQLLFLDVAAFFENCRRPSFSNIGNGWDALEWLCKVHDEAWRGMKRRLQDLERSGMIMYDINDRYELGPFLGVRDIYQRFAKWYVTNHGVKRLKNAWCVFESPGSTPNQGYVASDLVRLRMFDLSRTSARLLTSKTMRELHNLEVLQLYDCPYLTEVNLEGLESLRHLELENLRNLVGVTLTGSPNTAESGGILESLHYVVLVCLGSLVLGPDVRLCTSLYQYFVAGCPSMTNLDEMECPHLKELVLMGLVADQVKKLPNVRALHSLESFYFNSRGFLFLSDVEASRGVRLRDLGKPYLRVVEELFAYLRTEWVADDYIGGEQFWFDWRWKFTDYECLTLFDSSRGVHSWSRHKKNGGDG